MVVDWEPVTKFSDHESDENEEEAEKSPKKKKQTPFQEYLERRKTEKKKRKVLIKERKQKSKEEDEENRREIEANISAAKRRPKRSELATNLTADISDKRFDALFSSADFAIDKTNPHFQGGALADEQVRIKHDRKRKNADTSTSNVSTAVTTTTNEDLIKKLKAKSNKLRKT
uniref:NUC153 domain-containing protein n=1 Tax=Panagrolaimus davidi TaxID=227884 RepID=A0A914PN25_9BILA